MLRVERGAFCPEGVVYDLRSEKAETAGAAREGSRRGVTDVEEATRCAGRVRRRREAVAAVDRSESIVRVEMVSSL